MRLLRLAIAVTLLSWAPPAPAQQAEDAVSALRKEIEALKAGQAALQRELAEIKAILTRARDAAVAAETPPPVDLHIDRAPVKGDGNARLVLIEFTDYQCPFCARHVRQTMPQIEAEYVNAGKVRYAVRNFPLEAIHRQAFKAAEAAHCAEDQGQFWPMHERLFANPRALAPDDLRAHAQALGLDLSRFDACLRDSTHEARIRGDLAEGARAGVRGTPTFFLGVQDAPGSPVRVVRVLRGALPLTAFKTALDEALEPRRP
jgi:protein-disulfide isomerase